MNGKTIQDALEKASFSLNLANIERPRNEARLIVAYALNLEFSKLVALSEQIISDEKFNEIFELVKRRCEGEPYQYLVGKCEFMGLDFLVDSRVLIPRADTEIIVETALDICKKYGSSEKMNVLDMCTGSGCIAISIAHFCSNADVTAADISKAALEVAESNAQMNAVENRIKFVESNLFEKILNENFKYDLIVSNPPYLDEHDMENLQLEVTNEPQLALFGGQDGLDFYRQIAVNASKFLNVGGHILVEIGNTQAKAVESLFLSADKELNKIELIEVIDDYAQNNRVVKIRYK